MIIKEKKMERYCLHLMIFSSQQALLSEKASRLLHMAEQEYLKSQQGA